MSKCNPEKSFWYGFFGYGTLPIGNLIGVWMLIAALAAMMVAIGAGLPSN